MAFREKIDYLLLDIRELEKLIAGMRGAETYPVSFFNQSFGLTHKILEDLHRLESVQLNLLRKQMEEHEALLKDLPYKNTSSPSSFAGSGPAAAPGVEPQPADERPDVVTSGAVSFSAPQQDAGERTAGCSDDNEETEQPLRFERPEPLLPPEAGGATAAEGDEPAGMDRPAVTRPDFVPSGTGSTVLVSTGFSNGAQVAPSLHSQEDPAETAPAAGVAPAASKEKRAEPENAPAPSDVTAPSGINQAIPASSPSSVFLGEKVAPQNLSVNEVLERRKLSDFRRAFSLNDRFYFRRELFGGNEERMNQVIDRLNGIHSFTESLAYLKQELEWNLDDQAVADFIGLIEKRYAQ